MSEIESLLTTNQNFLELSAEHISELCARASVASFEAGQFICFKDGKADSFFVLTRGSVGLEIHAAGLGTVTVHTLQEGDLLGWSWMFPPYRWHFDARTLEPVEAIAFAADEIREKLSEDKAFGYEMMKIVAANMMDRITATRLQILDLYDKNSTGRRYLR